MAQTEGSVRPHDHPSPRAPRQRPTLSNGWLSLIAIVVIGFAVIVGVSMIGFSCAYSGPDLDCTWWWARPAMLGVLGLGLLGVVLALRSIWGPWSIRGPRGGTERTWRGDDKPQWLTESQERPAREAQEQQVREAERLWQEHQAKQAEKPDLADERPQWLIDKENEQAKETEHRDDAGDTT